MSKSHYIFFFLPTETTQMEYLIQNVSDWKHIPYVKIHYLSHKKKCFLFWMKIVQKFIISVFLWGVTVSLILWSTCVLFLHTISLKNVLPKQTFLFCTKMLFNPQIFFYKKIFTHPVSIFRTFLPIKLIKYLISQRIFIEIPQMFLFLF